MENPFLAHLSLLEEVCACIEQLCALSKRKTQAVRLDDVAALNQVMKEEQALSLTLRGLEQRRMEGLKSMGLAGIRLHELAEHVPPEFYLQAKATAERLQNQYRLYRSAAEVARNTLECNLHQIQKILAQAGGGAGGGPGYRSADVRPPKSLRTDFRA